MENLIDKDLIKKVNDELKQVKSVLDLIIKNEPLLNKWGMFIEIKHSQEDAEV